jgi:predicted dehydrogenase
VTEPLRLAVIGCGRVFERFHHPALLRSDDWVLVGAVDVRPARLRWLSGVRPTVPVAESLRALGEGPYDAVLVATPPDSHCSLGAEVLRRGAHLLIEKPLALDPSEAASLLSLARAGRRQVWVGFNRRFRPAYAALRRKLRDVAPERYRRIVFTLRTDPRRWDAVSRMAADPEQGGGLLDDLGSHQLDLLPWLLARRVEAVSARYERGDSAAVVVEMRLRFADGLEARCRAGHGRDTEERIEIDLGDRVLLATPGGLADLPRAAGGAGAAWLASSELLDAVGRRFTGRPRVTEETIQRQHREWADALRGRRTDGSAADGADGARCVHLTAACRHSLAGGGVWVAVTRAETLE